jgi:hypothetical protein
MTRQQERTDDAVARATRAAGPAGRAGGYCWVEHPKGGRHCTLYPGHRPPHYHCYSRAEFN